MITKVKLAPKSLPKEYDSCTCERCGAFFIPRLELDGTAWVQSLPVCCPSCRSVQWNAPRVNKKRGN